MNIENSRCLNSAAVFLSFGVKVTVQSCVCAELIFERARDGCTNEQWFPPCRALPLQEEAAPPQHRAWLSLENLLLRVSSLHTLECKGICKL